MTASWRPGEQSLGHSVLSAPQQTGRGLVDVLLVLGVVAMMTLSSFALGFFGIPYDSAGGSIVTKIHPGTYLFSLALALAVIANRNPVVYTLDLFLRCLGSTFLLLACLLMWAFISRFKPDYTVSFLIDSLIAPALIVFLFADAGSRTRLTIARLVHIILVFNCFLSIVEGLSGWRLFPFILNERAQTWEYRATGLLGHPLIGALITGVYAVILMTVRDVRGLSERWRKPIVLLCLVTMPFIGSRTSFTVVYAVGAVIAGRSIWGFLRGQAISVRTQVALLVLVPLALVALAGLYHAGVFDKFIDRFTQDKSSAQSRVLLFNLFKDSSLADWLFGQSSAALDTNVRLNGLTEGIENSWAGLLLRFGLVMSTVLWFGVIAWFTDLLRAAGRGAVLPIVFVLLIVSTTTGFSGKTTMLTIPAILILALVAKVSNVERSFEGNDLVLQIRRQAPQAASGGIRRSSRRR
ncbi:MULTISPECIES: VpsF family polysaccharide biosynthesis protein [unclassified Mesorhizobium]|uniref:VpsF family polysaccharide biosynthesis protein n=1 Tax=unclassified Mesorhizobium TaxID=325217 RepID=UPI00086BC5A1|nr:MULTISPECIES: VpsF family polysaccharide biosynthesis protein [unclassified Mesorhizobium]MBN9258068.1 VpsF family polysaccharide biosynthesis protein [Mesorhizobium sp.]ODT18378.1 MAG: hypothetical protein ABS57_06170 [Mesorhizobium sp. SCN 65-12]OJX82620.1 MAG: hypothetical protein BGO93_26060 [Mesorhizobium sp. 65-26]